MDGRQRYWTEFNDHLISSGSLLRTYKPSARNWMKIRHPVGFKRPKAHLAANAHANPELIAALIVLEDDDSLSGLDELLAARDLIEKEVGETLTWERKLSNKSSRRIILEAAASWRDESDWHRQFEWLRTRLDRMYNVFAPRLE